MQTIAQKITVEMETTGHKLLGQTSGTFTFRKGSNLSKCLERLGVTGSDVVVKAAARAGKNRNDGYQLLVFGKPGEGAVKFPDTIYETHQSWGGESYYYDADDMQTVIDDLIEAGGEDWADISIGDCRTYSFIKTMGNWAAYTGGWITDGYNRNGRREIAIFQPNGVGDGGFDKVESYDPHRDTDELEELGLSEQ